jgi:transcriptional regulator with XRE-family HTH domain
MGRRIRGAREAAHLTQEQLARRLGLKPTSVSHMEAGRQGVSVEQIERIAAACGVSPADLLSIDRVVRGGPVENPSHPTE